MSHKIAKNFNEENNILIESFFKRTFSNAWKKDKSCRNSLQIAINSIESTEKFDIILAWLKKNQYYPEIIVLVQEKFIKKSGLDELENISKRLKNLKLKLKTIIALPIENKKKDYEEYLKLANKLNLEFNIKLAPQHIKKAEETFLWLQKKFTQFDIPFWKIKFLEEKNKKWEPKQTKELINFIEFLIKWTLINHKDSLADLLFLKEGYGIISAFDDCKKIQNQSPIKIMADNLEIVPANEPSWGASMRVNFEVENNKIIRINGNNPEKIIGIISLKENSMPYCQTCVLKYLCKRNSLISQLEITGDLFSPIPISCKIEHAKIYGLIKALKKNELYEYIYCKLNREYKNSLDIIEELLPFSPKNKKVKEIVAKIKIQSPVIE